MIKSRIALVTVASLFVSSIALAQNAAPPAGGANNDTMGKDKTETGNGGMAGEPTTAKTPKVQGKSGSESGAAPADKMAPDKQ